MLAHLQKVPEHKPFQPKKLKDIIANKSSSSSLLLEIPLPAHKQLRLETTQFKAIKTIKYRPK